MSDGGVSAAILVDDAIIVGENIYTHFGRGKPPSQAVVDGLAEVGGPVVMAVSTTIVAFLPLMFITGIMGKFIAVMPQAVIIILAVSLVEALIILPAHLGNESLFQLKLFLPLLSARRNPFMDSMGSPRSIRTISYRASLYVSIYVIVQISPVMNRVHRLLHVGEPSL